LLNKIDWVTNLKIEQTSKKTEEKLGDLLWKIIKSAGHERDSSSVTASVDSLLSGICKTNDIDRSQIKLHIVNKAEINALTLPDNHLVIYTGLIAECENEAELCGVMAHEIAHMQKKHVMKKLVKELGLTVLISVSTGHGGGEMTKRILKQLSSSAYDRNLETEADMTGVDYLIKAHIDPEPFANLLFRLSEKLPNLPDELYWQNTHPESESRAKKIILSLKDKNIVKELILKGDSWKVLKMEMNREEE
jgi:predicted Zn-dependent protease